MAGLVKISDKPVPCDISVGACARTPRESRREVVGCAVEADAGFVQRLEAGDEKVGMGVVDARHDEALAKVILDEAASRGYFQDVCVATNVFDDPRRGYNECLGPGLVAVDGIYATVVEGEGIAGVDR